MVKKVGNWLLVIGSFVSFIGLLFLPAAFNAHGVNGDETLQGAGLTIFAMGAFLAAGGLYAKARALEAGIDSDPNLPMMLDGTRRKGTCDLCHKGMPVVACTMHKQNLCSICMVEHYESRSCVYIPAIRKSGRKPAKAGLAARA